MLLRLEKNAGKHRQNAEKPVIYLSLKTDENQNKKQIKMHCCTWALCATVQKEKVYVLRLKLTHTALVNTYIWTICHFDCGNVLERDWKLEETQKSENATAIFDRTGPTGQRRHLWRWTTLTGQISTWSELFHFRLDRNFQEILARESTPGLYRLLCQINCRNAPKIKTRKQRVFLYILSTALFENY